jgi:hypothetical protein
VEQMLIYNPLTHKLPAQGFQAPDIAFFVA